MKLIRIMSLLFASVASVPWLVTAFGQQQQPPLPQKAGEKADRKAGPRVTVPLNLVGRYEFPSDVKGRFDHLIADVHGHRLFTTPQGNKSVMVFDLRTHKLIHTIGGIEIPNGLLYREDLKRLYVTDGSPGELKIYSGENYDLIKSVRLLPDTDPIVYDPATKYLYVVNGGRDAKMSYSTISIIDTTSGDKVDEMKVDSPGLDAMAIEKSSPRLYVANVAQTKVEVIDRNARTAIASWPITLCTVTVALALDESNRRLFVGCRSGQIVVFDTETGKEMEALPINQNINDLVFDPVSKRLYATCGAGAGSVDMYEETDPSGRFPLDRTRGLDGWCQNFSGSLSLYHSTKGRTLKCWSIKSSKEDSHRDPLLFCGGLG
jgi:DNA-binding beta-propeller fold protein YncE